jgi:hypothetical protein
MSRSIFSLLAAVALLAGGCSCTGRSEGGDDGGGADDLGPYEGLLFPDTTPGDGAADGPVDPDDWDGDGVLNDVEKQLGTDPNNKDSDNDGIDDNQEIGDSANPTDGDGDGKIDALEPGNFDSDMDTIPDDQDQDDTDGPCGTVQRLFIFATLDQDTILSKSCSPYKVLGSLTVKNGATLTVKQDVTVVFGPKALLIIGDTQTKASLRLEGTSVYGVEHPVLLTADTDQPAKGFWRGVVVENGDAVYATHATVSYAGGATGSADEKALVLVKSADSITLSACTLSQGSGYGLHAAFAKSGTDKLFGAFKNNSFTGVDHAVALDIRHLGEIEGGNDFGSEGAGGEIRVSGSKVDQNAAWAAHGVPYVFEEQTIDVDADLNIQGGAKLIVADNTVINVGYNSTGRLAAVGTSSEPVVLTTASGNADSWQGVVLSSGQNSLQHLKVVGAGHVSWTGTDAAIYVSVYASYLVKGVVVENSSGYGVFINHNESGCSLVPTAEFSFNGTIAKCPLFCTDDSGGNCLTPSP